MRIVNTGALRRYSTASHTEVAPQGRSADVDMFGIVEAMRRLVKSCGSTFVLKLNAEERMLLDRIERLAKAGDEFRPAPVRDLAKEREQARRESHAAETRAKMASVAAMREAEKAIQDEATYSTRRDRADARAAAARLEGEIDAKRLEKSEGISISDLMGDNRFIEEGMKSSGVKTVIAPGEAGMADTGWDVERMKESGNLAPDAAEAYDAEQAEQAEKANKAVEVVEAEQAEAVEATAPEQAEPAPEPAPEPVQEPAKKRSSKRKGK